MKIEFVTTPTPRGGTPQTHVPLGLISLATVLNGTSGLRAGILNLNRRSCFRDPQEIAREILDREPDAIGFSCLASGYAFSLELAGWCKRLQPKVKVLFGGIQPTVCAETTARHFPQVDRVVRGECETRIAPVLNALDDPEALAKIPGVTFMDRGKLLSTPPAEPIPDLNCLPLPDYSLFPDCREVFSLPLEIGRGCPFPCSFCCIRSVSGRTPRLYTPDRIVRLIARLDPTHPTHDFTLFQDTFNFHRDWVLTFCRILRETGLAIRWGTFARIDRLDDELLEAMAAAGCWWLYFGLESASPRLQSAFGKHFDAGMVDRVLSKARELGIQAVLSYIIGFPDETPQEMAATIRQATRYRYDIPWQPKTRLHVLAPLTGSPLYEQYRDRLQFDGIYSDFVVDILNPEQKQLVQRHPDMFSVFFHFPLQHLRRPEVTRAAYLFEVLAAMRYTCFWLLHDPGFRYPEGLLESALLDTLPERLRWWDRVETDDIEAVIRFLRAGFPELLTGDHPLPDIMAYDLTLLQCRAEGSRIRRFEWDVRAFAREAGRGGFRELHEPPPGPVTLLFTPDGGDQEVRVRRLPEFPGLRPEIHPEKRPGGR